MTMKTTIAHMIVLRARAACFATLEGALLLMSLFITFYLIVKTEKTQSEVIWLTKPS